MKTENQFVECLVSSAPDTVRSDGLVCTMGCYENAVEKLNQKGTVFGEIVTEHEMKYVEYSRLFTIREHRMACEAKDFKLTPEGITAKVRLLDTPFGNAAKGLIADGLLEKGLVRFGVRVAINKLDLSGFKVTKLTPITVDFVIVDFVLPK